jgi:hypothetical protein
MSFEIVQVPARAIACIRLKVPMSEMPLVFGPAIMELVSVLAQQSMQPDGAAFAHHFHCDGESFDFEVGFFLPENCGLPLLLYSFYSILFQNHTCRSGASVWSRLPV